MKAYFLLRITVVRVIQSHSTVEKDYLTNGFWVLEKAEEARNDNISACFPNKDRK